MSKATRGNESIELAAFKLELFYGAVNWIKCVDIGTFHNLDLIVSVYSVYGYKRTSMYSITIPQCGLLRFHYYTSQ